ncbi:MAG: hypothetical protein V1875_03505 [Candidatus Altiarchaeota archaeon]
MPNADSIMELLKDLKEAHPQIQACMVAKKGLEGLILFPADFKTEVSSVWEPLSRNIDDMLTVVQKYSCIGQTRLYSEILGFGTVYLPLPMTDTALIVFVKEEDPLKAATPCIADMETTRKAILEI